MTTLICVLLMITMIAASRRGLMLGMGTEFRRALLLLTFATLILLPFITAGRGTLAHYHPFSTSVPPMMHYNINVFSKLAIGAFPALSTSLFSLESVGARAEYQSLCHESRRRSSP